MMWCVYFVSYGSNYGWPHEGFKNGKDACCGLIGLESGVLCNFMSPVCENPTQYVFWDGYHPTERAYKIMIDELIARYIKFLR